MHHFIITNQCIKYLKYKLNMNNKAFAFYKNICQIQQCIITSYTVSPAVYHLPSLFQQK